MPTLKALEPYLRKGKAVHIPSREFYCKVEGGELRCFRKDHLKNPTPFWLNLTELFCDEWAFYDHNKVQKQSLNDLEKAITIIDKMCSSYPFCNGCPFLVKGDCVIQSKIAHNSAPVVWKRNFLTFLKERGWKDSDK